MAQTKILVDTNSYLRLAQNIHPLLCKAFGKESFTLYMHADLNAEFRSSSRLQNKFDWVSEFEYKENRKRSVSLSNKQKEAIEETFDFMWQHVVETFHQQRQKGPSPIDTKILATALVLEIQVVTDDQDMIELAAEYDVQHLTSLSLMKQMLDEKHITIDKVEQVVAQWQYDNDTPYRNWKTEYKQYFKKQPPLE